MAPFFPHSCSFSQRPLWLLILDKVLTDAWTWSGPLNGFELTERGGVNDVSLWAGEDRRHSSSASEEKDTVRPWVGTLYGMTNHNLKAWRVISKAFIINRDSFIRISREEGKCHDVIIRVRSVTSKNDAIVFFELRYSLCKQIFMLQLVISMLTTAPQWACAVFNTANHITCFICIKSVCVCNTSVRNGENNWRKWLGVQSQEMGSLLSHSPMWEWFSPALPHLYGTEVVLGDAKEKTWGMMWKETRMRVVKILPISSVKFGTFDSNFSRLSVDAGCVMFVCMCMSVCIFTKAVSPAVSQ